jgi:hypothetical protein
MFACSKKMTLKFHPPPSLDPELKKRHYSVMAQKAVDRRRYGRKVGIAAVPLIISALGIFYSSTFKAPGIVSASLAFLFAGSIIFLLAYGYRTLPKVINPLDPLDRALESLHCNQPVLRSAGLQRSNGSATRLRLDAICLSELGRT